MSTFSTDHAAALEGPDWLRARRVAAAERFHGAALPTDAEEVWRYSRIGKLDLDAYAPARTGAGFTTTAVLDPALAAKGVYLGPVSGLADGAEVLGSVCAVEVDAFVTLHDALVVDPLVLRVPAGVIVEEPIEIRHVIDADGTAVFPRLVVSVGEDAQVTVLEHLSSGDVSALVVPVTELDVAPAGRLRYLLVQELGPRVWQLAHQEASGARDSFVHASAVALGGDYARLRQDARLVGQGASSELLAVYFGEDNQMHDFRTMQDHVAPRTTSELLFKGAVEDHAHGVYSGLIRIRREGQKSDARQTNRNLVLSEGAHADSVPNLEIEADDVKCSHATAVGPIDDAERFYVESRGIPPEKAERLIVLGFFGEVFERMPVPALTPALRAAVAEKLQRRSHP
jgi:Fe-S cluster assembly protein SufD